MFWISIQLTKSKSFTTNHQIQLAYPIKSKSQKKTMTPKKILSSSLQETYRTFREQYPECSVSFSKFVSLRPKQVHTMSRNTFNNCLCEYCTNIELKVKAINFIIGCKGDLRNRYNASRKTLCPKEDRFTFYKRECVERNCSSCGTDDMIYNISDLLKKKCSKLEWSKWENQTLTIQGKKKTRKMLQLKKSGRFGALKSDSTHHFFRNACTKSGSLRFSQFSGC